MGRMGGEKKQLNLLRLTSCLPRSVVHSPADDGCPVAVATAAEGAIRGQEVWFALLM